MPRPKILTPSNGCEQMSSLRSAQRDWAVHGSACYSFVDESGRKSYWVGDNPPSGSCRLWKSESYGPLSNVTSLWLLRMVDKYGTGVVR